MTKTTADEALEAINQTEWGWYVSHIASTNGDGNKYRRGYEPDEKRKITETIRTALSLLSAVQGGKCKVLEREPNDAMVKSTDHAMKSVNSAIMIADLHGGGITWVDGKCPMYHAYRAMYDAAESYAAPSAAEVGE